MGYQTGTNAYQKGADVNTALAIKRGCTAIDRAADHGRLDIIQLHNAGAKRDTIWKTGFKKAIELAEENRQFILHISSIKPRGSNSHHNTGSRSKPVKRGGAILLLDSVQSKDDWDTCHKFLRNYLFIEFKPYFNYTTSDM